MFCAKFSDNYVVSGGTDKAMRIWDMQSGECLRTIHHPEAVSSVAIEGNLMVSGCGDNNLRFWDLRSGQIMRVVKAHAGGITCVQMMGDTIATGSADKTAKIWSFNM